MDRCFPKSIGSRFPMRVTDQSTCHLVVNPSGNVKFSRERGRGNLDGVSGTRRRILPVDFGKNYNKSPGKLILGIDLLSSICGGI